MIKETLINHKENFFIQSFLLLLPTLIFSESLSYSVFLGGASLFSIYLMTLIYYFSAPLIKKQYSTPFIIGIGGVFSVIISSLSYYFYESYYLNNSYLVNIFFVSLFIWHKAIFRNKKNIKEIITKDVPTSLLWVYLFLILFSLVKEILGTGSLNFLNFSFIVIPIKETISNLNSNFGKMIVFTLTLLSLRLLPNFYLKPEEEEANLKAIDKDSKDNESLLEKTKRLETLLNEGLIQK